MLDALRAVFYGTMYVAGSLFFLMIIISFIRGKK